MSFNLYKKEFYTSPRHLSILRESPEDMFLSGERSEDIYVNFEDRAFSDAPSTFIKPLPSRPNKPPPPVPNCTGIVQPIHPPVPFSVQNNSVTMVTASTQTISENRVNCMESSVPDILAFTLNSNSHVNNNQIITMPNQAVQPSHPYSFPPNCDNIDKAHIDCQEGPMNYSDSSVDFGLFLTNYINMMHDSVSWIVTSSENVSSNPESDICRFEMRRNAEKEFYNMINENIDLTMREHYLNVFSSIQQIRNYCETLRVIAQYHTLTELNNYLDYEPGEAVCNLMKMSFNENYRRIICSLGGLEALAQLIVINNSVLGDMANNYHLTVRRYTCMALTNLTFGISENKAFLCSIKSVLQTLVDFLSSCSEEVKQVSASVIRNLSWKADDETKQRLREANVSKVLTSEAMKCAKESCLKSILSALWNISAHSKENKVDICEVQGSLAYFVDVLSFKTISLVENSGGILRNISSIIAGNDKYRLILRQNNAFQILLKHLRSSSLTVVGNACGTLCNLSLGSSEDQRLLWNLGAVGMLKNLVHSKHRTISTGAAATLKNLLSARASLNIAEHVLVTALKSNSTSSSNSPDSSPRITSPSPSLHVRKLNALESDIENILRDNKFTLSSSENKGMHDFSFIDSPLLISRQNKSKTNSNMNILDNSNIASIVGNTVTVKRSGSDESMVSAYSDLTYDKAKGQCLNSNNNNNNSKMKANLPNQPKSATDQSSASIAMMSLSGYSNSSGHYDLTVEHCMKISNFPAQLVDSNILADSSNIIVGKKQRDFHSYPEEYDSDNSEKPLDYSRQFGDTDEYMVYPTTLISRHNSEQNHSNTPQAANNIFRNIINIPPPTIKEKPKVYATEGTPVQCGSRMSPLSEEIEEDDRMLSSNRSTTDNFPSLNIIPEDQCCYTVSKKPNLEKIDEVSGTRSSSSTTTAESNGLNNNNKTNKCVKFESEPPQIIQDTPLMFSRTSSVGSLDSFETHSIHSSVQSEYSRRTSELVSPSELPDSPGSEVVCVVKSPPRPPHKSSTAAVSSKPNGSSSPAYSSSLSIDDNNSTGNPQDCVAILHECIQSGMPYSNSKATGSKSLKSESKSTNEQILEATVSYAVEGTPFNYSTKASSLSEISIPDPLTEKEELYDLCKGETSSSDSDEHSELLSEIIQSAMPKGINSSASVNGANPNGNNHQGSLLSVVSTRNNNCSTFINNTNPSQFKPCGVVGVPGSAKLQSDTNPEFHINKLPQFYYCDIDSPRQYGVEGTPNSISQRDSICSESNFMIKVSTDIYPKSSTNGVPPKPPKRTTSTLSSAAQRSKPNNVNNHYITEENNIISSVQEEVHVYMTENTPADYSRASPVSHSLIDTPDLNIDDSKNVGPDNCPMPDVDSNNSSKSGNDDKSSLSSLSIESAGMERTLLQQCISSAMPVPKLKPPTTYSRKSHNTDSNISVKSKCNSSQSDTTSNNIFTAVSNNESTNSNAREPIMEAGKSNTQAVRYSQNPQKPSGIKSPCQSGLPVSVKNSKSVETRNKKSFIPTPKTSQSVNESATSSKASSEKSVNSYPKSKSSCSLKSVLGYNPCLSLKNKQQIPTTCEQAVKVRKEKPEQSKNCSFLVNGFDVSQRGLAASKSNPVSNASPVDVVVHDESRNSIVSIDSNTYSIDNAVKVSKIAGENNVDIGSDTDTLELVEINGLIDDDFLRLDSSSLEIDAAFYRNSAPHNGTDDEISDNELDFTNRRANKHLNEIMKDGAEAILASLSIDTHEENGLNFLKETLSNNNFCTESFSSDSLNLEIDIISNTSRSSDQDRPRRPRIVKPSDDMDSLSDRSQSAGIRGGRKSLTGRKPSQNQIANPKLLYNKAVISPLCDGKNNKTKVSNKKTIPKSQTKTASQKHAKSVSSIPTIRSPEVDKRNYVNSNSKIPSFGKSDENIKAAVDRNKYSNLNKKRISSSQSAKLNFDGLPCDAKVSSHQDTEDNSEGLWILRNELCPDTVCIN